MVEVLGFDYYNPKTGTVESGGKGILPCGCLIPTMTEGEPVPLSGILPDGRGKRRLGDTGKEPEGGD